jgi:hypothetical protein
VETFEAMEIDSLEGVLRLRDRTGVLSVYEQTLLDAIDASRVERLLLLLDGHRPPTGDVDAKAPEDPLFADRILLRTHDTDAELSVVSGDAARALGGVGGIAAILRG